MLRRNIGSILLPILIIVAVAATVLSPNQAFAARSIQSDPRYASIVIDVNTGKVMYSRQADRQRYPASLTKIMTLYMLFEAMRDGKVTKTTRMRVSRHAAAQAPSKLGLAPGKTISVDAAIRALVTKSANDIAAVIAEHLAGTEAKFARQMTIRARALGMSKTTFKNASGLPNRAQTTTARDMARLGQAIIRDFPRQYAYFSTRSFTYSGRRYGNHNRLLGNVRGVDGIKTGYTRASGFNLTTSVRRDNRHVIAVVMGGPTGRARDNHMRWLLNRFVPKAVAQTQQQQRVKIDVASMPTPSPRPDDRQVVIAAAPAAPSQPAPQQAAANEIDTDRGVIAASVSVPQTFAILAQAQLAQNTAANTNQPRPAPVASPETVASLTPAPAPEPVAQSVQVQQGSVAGQDDNLANRIENQWLIQIGAYGRESAATSRLNQAKTAASNVLANGNAYTEPVVRNDKTIYRARFRGFDRASAKNACRELKRANISCLPMPFE